MGPFRMRFIVGKLTEDDLQALKRGEPVVSKLLLVPDDYSAFHYAEGDEIEAETHEGNRIWTTIRNIEVVGDNYRVIVILTLVRKAAKDKK